jgi:two-component system response regulator HydG
MRASELKVLELLDFRAAEGVIAFHDQRMLLYDADVLGILRRELVETLGLKAARGLLTRFGYADGYQDAHTLEKLFRWETLEERVKAGPVLHALEGKAVVVQTRLSGLVDGGRFEAEIAWENCYETEQHLRHLGPATEPVCWTLAGYMSGYVSACLGEEIYFVEVECCATGRGCCRAVGRRPGDWGADLAPHLEYFKAASVQEEIARLEQALRRQRRAASRQKREAERWKTLARRLQEPQGPVAKSRAMREVLELAERAAGADATVLLTGESGTGKELVARFIHDRSTRATGPFVAVNCGALPEPLLESELFGHVRGSFTGAVADKKGLFEAAGHGTLLLDEVGDTPAAIQVKLLRALQEREIRRVGATTPVRVDVRILAATNRDLAQAVAAREFRRDLYYRLNVINIRIPPLRERRDDIVPLARLFLDRDAAAQGKEIRAISADALDLLTSYPWPGNVRELENVIERAVVLARRDRITVADLSHELRAGGGLPMVDDLPGSLPLQEVEKRAILAMLDHHRGNRARTAKALGISPQTLWRKLRAYEGEAGRRS